LGRGQARRHHRKLLRGAGVQAILPENATLLYAGEEQETLRKGRLSATPDGLAIGLDRDALAELGVEDIITGDLLIEFKSFDPRANPTEPKPIHAGQVQVQFGLVHELTDYRPEYAIIVYMNASFLSDIRVFVIKREPEDFRGGHASVPSRSSATRTRRTCRPKASCPAAAPIASSPRSAPSLRAKPRPRRRRRSRTPRSSTGSKLLAQRQTELAEAEKEAKQDKKVVEEEIKEILRTNDTKGAGESGRLDHLA
jgi:hypothetical protein